MTMLTIKTEELISGFRLLTTMGDDGHKFEMICDERYRFVDAVNVAVAIEYGTWCMADNFRLIKVRPSSCPQHIKAMQNFVMRYWRPLSNGTMDKSIEYTETGKALSNLLTGWEGIYDSNGNAIPFSKENALLLMTKKATKTFRASVVDAADKLDAEMKQIANWNILT